MKTWTVPAKLGAMLMATGLVGLGLLLPPARAQRADDIDFAKAKAIQKRVMKGEAVSDEDRAYVAKAKAEFARRKGLAGAAKATFTPRESTGLVPLTDLKGEARYKGEDGGLYGEGRNEPPGPLLKAATAVAAKVRPLDLSGKPADLGKVVLISIGMSNTTQEFSQFVAQARRDPEISPAVVLVDGAQGGVISTMWAHPDRMAKAARPDPWKVLDDRIKAAGASPEQVQVAWLKNAIAGPAALGDFPKHAEVLKDDTALIVGKLKEKFPNLRLVYFSSRIYAGYASTPLNPEPYAYESAFAVRRAIRDAARGESIGEPVLLWGPYLWADGVKGRASDGLVWKREDLGEDGTHPSPSGRRKVADLLLKFFKSDPTATGWFTRGGGGS
jgi:hypothetical protein